MSLLNTERRRRRLHDEGEDVQANNVGVVAGSSECESEDESATIELSEYGSAVDDSADQEDETEDGSETETEGSETEDTGSQTEGYTDEEGIAEERQSGDGEEQPENDKPDDDEDKKNPAYVPRKGAFYEHDFRRGDEGTEVEQTEEAKPKKKLWQDEGKWSHDKYIENMQAPKTRQELIEIYGYDIRSSDRPPEAPPKRKQRSHEPRKQHFKDFLPQMAVIDTTEGGQDSVPNLDDDDFIQYKAHLNKINRGNKAQNADARRGGRHPSRGGYQSSDIEAKNSRNRQDNNRVNHESFKNIEGHTPNSFAVEDFPSLQAGKQNVYKDAQSLKRNDKNNRTLADSKFNDRSQKFHQYDNYDNSNRGQYNHNNWGGKVQHTQDIRKQEDSREKNRTQQTYKDERREVFNNGRVREGGGFNNPSQNEKWRNGPNEFKDSYKGESYNKNDSYAGTASDYGYNSRKQQVTGRGNRGSRVSNSGDALGYFNNKRGNRTFDQPLHQQSSDTIGVANKEYTNSSYKYPESKPSNLLDSSSAVPNADTSGGGSSNDAGPTNSKSLVISNKENVQTINVTITNTTTEKKSYAKERRAKGISRPVEGAVMMDGSNLQTNSVASLSGNPYQSLPSASSHMEIASTSIPTGSSQYSSHRQQGMFTEPPLVGGAGAKLYNPSLPPPTFYQRDHGGLPPSQLPAHTPALLPPATALPFVLPVSSPGLALPPNAAGMPTNPALFQPPAGPPPTGSITAPGTALLAAQFLPAGMMYGGGPRVPPPGTPAAFPLTLAYTSPPPQGNVAAGVVGSQTPSQGATPAPGIQSTSQHKKVYRGDITYYAPELQQPSRTPQKRPKAAIPIIDPQEVPRQKVKEKPELRLILDKSSASANIDLSSQKLVLSAEKPTSIREDTVKEIGQQSKLQNSSAAFSQGAGAAAAAVLSSSQVPTASMAYSPNFPEAATANSALLVGHSDSMKSSPSLDGLELKRMVMKTELSPGGPPVNNITSNSTVLNRDTQSICTGIQNLHVENGVNKTEVAIPSLGVAELKQEIAEKPVINSNESSVAERNLVDSKTLLIKK